MYERQQQDLCLLHLNLESTKSLLDQQGTLQYNKQSEQSRKLEQNQDSESEEKNYSGLSKDLDMKNLVDVDGETKEKQSEKENNGVEER